MKFSEIEVPSNRKFGIFFTAVFTMVAVYLYYTNTTKWSYISSGVGLAFLVVSIIKAEALLPLNKLWMRFGVLLGMIVSPIILGIIFFGIFTPIATLMRIFGRDELHLRLKKKATYWISRKKTEENNSFKNQF